MKTLNEYDLKTLSVKEREFVDRLNAGFDRIDQQLVELKELFKKDDENIRNKQS